MSKYEGLGATDYTCDACGNQVRSGTLPGGWVEQGDDHRCCPTKSGESLPMTASVNAITTRLEKKYRRHPPFSNVWTL